MACLTTHTLEANVGPFLDMLAYAEIGPALLADPATNDGYRVLVGSTPARLTLFSDYRGHPIARDANAIEYAPGHYSSAAGRYQIVNTYWDYYARLLKLADFSPESQDRYAVQQLREQRALAPIRRGEVSAAIARCANIWASLPGAGYGQPEHSLADLRAAFRAAGGIVIED